MTDVNVELLRTTMRDNPHFRKLVAEEVERELKLNRVQETQTAFWNALTELETELGCELDSQRDFAEMTIENLLEEQES